MSVLQIVKNHQLARCAKCIFLNQTKPVEGQKCLSGYVRLFFRLFAPLLLLAFSILFGLAAIAADDTALKLKPTDRLHSGNLHLQPQALPPIQDKSTILLRREDSLVTLGNATTNANTEPENTTPIKPTPQMADPPFSLFATFLKLILSLVILVVITYTGRHYVFTIQRLFGRQLLTYLDVSQADWPSLTIFVAAHNEERVIADSLTALLDVDYPRDRLTIVPVNDRSTDRTREIIDRIAATAPELIKPFHRTSGKPGKAAALKDATAHITDEIVVIFDADYLPGKGLIKQLVTPFFDPEVGATMGRVVPINRDVNLLTQMLDLERAGGYQVDQQARANLHLTPQYGGTVGGIRTSALEQVGGWADDVLAEDTDITYRLRCAGWKIVYQNRSECYEEVPEEWAIRIKQLRRWAKGHHQVLMRQWRNVITSPQLNRWEKIDASLLLTIFLVSPVMLIGWVAALLLFYMGQDLWVYGGFAVLAVACFASLGNFAAFFEIAGAVFLDGQRQRMALMPLGFSNFLISLIEISRATATQSWDTFRGNAISWDKTQRYRAMPPPPSTVQPEDTTATPHDSHDNKGVAK